MRIDFTGTRFLETSRTSPYPNRLNQRCEVLLTRNRDAIEGRRVLDLASHDGRFSWACAKLGAARVTGVEARAYLVEHARANLGNLHSGAEVSFVHDDVLTFLEKCAPGQFDTLLCFGFLYHTTRQVEFFRHLKRLRPAFFILDTIVAKPLYKFFFKIKKPRQVPALIFMDEDSSLEANTADPDNITAMPSSSFIELMLAKSGYAFRRLEWNPSNWEALKDYKMKHRISYRAVPA